MVFSTLEVFIPGKNCIHVILGTILSHFGVKDERYFLPDEMRGLKKSFINIYIVKETKKYPRTSIPSYLKLAYLLANPIVPRLETTTVRKSDLK